MLSTAITVPTISVARELVEPTWASEPEWQRIDRSLSSIAKRRALCQLGFSQT